MNNKVYRQDQAVIPVGYLGKGEEKLPIRIWVVRGGRIVVETGGRF